MSLKKAYLSAVCKEMEMRKEYLGNDPVETIYFGGGTPSQLQAGDFDLIFETIYRTFPADAVTEITLEANPDDMTESYIQSLRSLPFNRISMGIQSFHEDDLRFLRRRHSGAQAIQAVSTCQENGFDNISIDLIYGLPGQTPERWEKNLNETLRLGVPHISAYHLTYEENTPLFRLLEKKEITPIDEEASIVFFNTLLKTLTRAGYIHYEISNFACPGRLSLHNSSYWTGKKYLGIGPSAHSYDQLSRQWNVSSLTQYMEGIHRNSPVTETELLNLHKRYNDYIITGLRTMWGIHLPYILTNFGETIHNYCLKQATPSLNRGLLIKSDDKLLLSQEGMLVSDAIMRDLLCV